MQKLSIVIPMCDEAANVEPLVACIRQAVPDFYELLFVDDGSRDDTLRQIQRLASVESRIKCISLSRNFGHQNALMAGLEHASGDVIVTMDGDLQHPPALLPKMAELVQSGTDIVFTKRRTTAGTNAIKNGSSHLFYRVFNSLSDTKVQEGASEFKAFNRKVLETVTTFRERELFLRGLFHWIGFSTATLEYEAPARLAGRSKFSNSSMLRLALKSATAFSYKPLRISFAMGCIISLGAFLFAIFAFVQYTKGHTIPGWTSTILALMFLSGTQLITIGLLGEYIGNIYQEVKGRPRYIVNKRINF